MAPPLVEHGPHEPEYESIAVLDLREQRPLSSIESGAEGQFGAQRAGRHDELDVRATSPARTSVCPMSEDESVGLFDR